MSDTTVPFLIFQNAPMYVSHVGFFSTGDANNLQAAYEAAGCKLFRPIRKSDAPRIAEMFSYMMRRYIDFDKSTPNFFGIIGLHLTTEHATMRINQIIDLQYESSHCNN